MEKMQITESSPENANSTKKTWNIDFRGMNCNFFQCLKNGKSSTFQNFFFNFEIGHKKMSKMDFKKKVCKNENHFFFDFFFSTFFSRSYYDNWSNDFSQKDGWDHKKKG